METQYFSIIRAARKKGTAPYAHSVPIEKLWDSTDLFQTAADTAMQSR
jgi:hypothetical protein